MDYQVLWTELSTDPAAIGYLVPTNAANDVANAALLNDENQLVDRTSITATELWENTDLVEYAALLAAQRQAYGVLVTLGQIDVTPGSNSRATLAAIFAAGSATRANLIALASEKLATSRASILGFPRIYTQDIETARERFGQ